MSFDVFLLKFSRSDPVCELPRDAFERVIQKHRVRQTSERFYNIELQDGGFVEVQIGSPRNSQRFTTATFFIRGINESIIRLLFECAQATGGVLIPTMDPSPCILVDVSQRDELPPDFTLRPVECRSAEELAQLLHDGFQAWSRYRDQIVHGHDRSNPTD